MDPRQRAIKPAWTYAFKDLTQSNKTRNLTAQTTHNELHVHTTSHGTAWSNTHPLKLQQPFLEDRQLGRDRHFFTKALLASFTKIFLSKGYTFPGYITGKRDNSTEYAQGNVLGFHHGLGVANNCTVMGAIGILPSSLHAPIYIANEHFHYISVCHSSSTNYRPRSHSKFSRKGWHRQIFDSVCHTRRNRSSPQNRECHIMSRLWI